MTEDFKQGLATGLAIGGVTVIKQTPPNKMIGVNNLLFKAIDIDLRITASQPLGTSIMQSVSFQGASENDVTEQIYNFCKERIAPFMRSLPGTFIEEPLTHSTILDGSCWLSTKSRQKVYFGLCVQTAYNRYYIVTYDQFHSSYTFSPRITSSSGVYKASINYYITPYFLALCIDSNSFTARYNSISIGKLGNYKLGVRFNSNNGNGTTTIFETADATNHYLLPIQNSKLPLPTNAILSTACLENYKPIPYIRKVWNTFSDFYSYDVEGIGPMMCLMLEGSSYLFKI